VNGTPAGVGELTAIGDTANWGYLGSAAVVPRFRRLGIQTALLRHRFRVAFNRAYELVTSGADFGSTSFRNQQRVGLRLAYVEATWRHDRNAPGDPA
jgi:GNAT superfamily N-acetyltransferase